MNHKLYKPFYDPNVTLKNKKYSVYVKNDRGDKKLIHFGQIGYQQYEDKVSGRYSSDDHHDKKRRDNYRRRHNNDKIKNRNYPGYWSYNYLW